MNSFYVCVTFDSIDELHAVHDDIREQKFILGANFSNVKDARKLAVDYINDFMDLKYGVGEWKHLPDHIPLESTYYGEINDYEDGYYCSEFPKSWQLTVWKKTTKNGFFSSWAETTRVLSVDIIPRYFPSKGPTDKAPVVMHDNPLFKAEKPLYLDEIKHKFDKNKRSKSS